MYSPISTRLVDIYINLIPGLCAFFINDLSLDTSWFLKPPDRKSFMSYSAYNVMIVIAIYTPGPVFKWFLLLIHSFHKLIEPNPPGNYVI